MKVNILIILAAFFFIISLGLFCVTLFETQNQELGHWFSIVGAGFFLASIIMFGLWWWMENKSRIKTKSKEERIQEMAKLITDKKAQASSAELKHGVVQESEADEYALYYLADGQQQLTEKQEPIEAPEDLVSENERRKKILYDLADGEEATGIEDEEKDEGIPVMGFFKAGDKRLRTAGKAEFGISMVDYYVPSENIAGDPTGVVNPPPSIQTPVKQAPVIDSRVQKAVVAPNQNLLKLYGQRQEKVENEKIKLDISPSAIGKFFGGKNREERLKELTMQANRRDQTPISDRVLQNKIDSAKANAASIRER